MTHHGDLDGDKVGSEAAEPAVQRARGDPSEFGAGHVDERLVVAAFEIDLDTSA